mmetsp:Transcript_108219/g.303131  ORF Transcript_108219/g.303131 Transcript_108219/m.303131 type:complete len:212 (+) Transcript_108219:218-853(+)
MSWGCDAAESAHTSAIRRGDRRVADDPENVGVGDQPRNLHRMHGPVVANEPVADGFARSMRQPDRAQIEHITMRRGATQRALVQEAVEQLVGVRRAGGVRLHELLQLRLFEVGHAVAGPRRRLSCEHRSGHRHELFGRRPKRRALSTASISLSPQRLCCGLRLLCRRGIVVNRRRLQLPLKFGTELGQLVHIFLGSVIIVARLPQHVPPRR